MKGGFSFCGVDIADLGLEYAPENKDAYVYAPAESNIHEETFEGHDGGYSYGASKQPKQFTLRCYYEDKNIAQGLMAKVLDLFKVGKKGMLIFKRRPWCYYYATVTAKPDISQIYTYLNGIIVITMKAYYPFARGLSVNDHLFYNLYTDNYHKEIMQNTAILDKAEMVPSSSFSTPNILGGNKTTSNVDLTKKYIISAHDSNFHPGEEAVFRYAYFNENNEQIRIKDFSLEEDGYEIVPNDYMPFTQDVAYIKFTNVGASITIDVREYISNIILYNPGTERAKVDIIIAGSSDGITIANSTTQQSCRYVSFNTENNDYIYTDGINGKTILDSDGQKTLAFLTHDYGFIELEPAFPILRDIYVSYQNAIVTATNVLYQEEDEKDWYSGKYIYLEGTSDGWYKINRCTNKHTLELTKNTNNSGSCKTSIVIMNEITITSDQGTKLNRLSFVYKPTYS